ncbi:MAG: hypothetical protein WBG11_07145 [Methylocella sp.]
MSKIIDAQDSLTHARSCVELIFMAACGLGDGLKHKATDPIQVVADMASTKIDEAIALLEEYRTDRGEGPVPAAKSPAARTKRNGK